MGSSSSIFKSLCDLEIIGVFLFLVLLLKCLNSFVNAYSLEGVGVATL